MVRRRTLRADAQSDGGSDTQSSKNEYDDAGANDRAPTYRNECRVVVRHHDPRYFATIQKPATIAARIDTLPSQLQEARR